MSEQAVREDGGNTPSDFGSQEVEFNWSPVQTRFIKIDVKPYGVIPQGKAGAGNPPWLFADEMIID